MLVHILIGIMIGIPIGITITCLNVIAKKWDRDE